MSASKWLAKSLDYNSDIICTHSAAQMRKYDANYSPEQLGTVLKAERELLSKQFTESFFESMPNNKQHKVSGNVHALRLRNIGSPEHVAELQKSFTILNLLRHPVNWALSCANQYALMYQADRETIGNILNASHRENREFYEKISQKYGVDLNNIENISFLNACTILYKLAEEIRNYPNVSHIQMEKITTDKEYFKNIFKLIVKEQLHPTKDYLDKVFSIGAINMHAGSMISTPESIYKSMPDWKRYALDIKMEECGIIEQYEKIGYEKFTTN